MGLLILVLVVERGRKKIDDVKTLLEEKKKNSFLKKKHRATFPAVGVERAAPVVPARQAPLTTTVAEASHGGNCVNALMQRRSLWENPQEAPHCR